MKPELPLKPKPEKEPFPEIPEMSPEDFQEMLDQIPILKEMLAERKAKLEALKTEPDAYASGIWALENEIEELEAEIEARQEAL